jgi:hypothetical protein
MPDAKVEALLEAMERASDAGDHGEVMRLREALQQMRPNTRGPRVGRPEPGEMGADPNQTGQALRPGWAPPPKPDLMTSNTKAATRRRR